MAQSPPRLVYLAVADARGHLMRAHLLHRLLAEDGVQVDVVTTSEEGQQFLAALGTPSSRISSHFRVEFGARHDMQHRATAKRVAQYLARPERGLNDLVELSRLARGAAFVVNDSLHPALLAAAAVGRPFRVVHVAGENLWAAAATHLDDQSGPVRDAYRKALNRSRDRAFGRITHTLGEPSAAPHAKTWALPPIVAAPSRGAAEMRSRLGEPLAVVYLNPHYQDPRIAANVEAAIAKRGYALYGVSEVFAGRRGWVARDGQLADAIAAADVYISGAGMAALEQARAYGTPFVALLGSQPEQAKNLEGLLARGAAPRIAQVGSQTEASLCAALEGLPLRTQFEDSRLSVLAVHRAWRDAFRALIAVTEGDRRGADRRSGADRRRVRDQQPAEQRP